MPAIGIQPAVDKARLLEGVHVPTIDADDDALENLLCEIRIAKDSFQQVAGYATIQLAKDGAVDLVMTERQFADLLGRIDFLKTKAAQEQHLAQKILSTIEDIRILLQNSRAQVDVALEYFELSGPVMSELDVVADECQALVSEIQAYSPRQLPDMFEVDGLVKSLNQSPILDHGKFVCLTNEDRELSAKLIKLTKKIRPLRISLDFLNMRVSKLEERIDQFFPSASTELTKMQHKLDTKYKRLSEYVDATRQELGEDRWVAMLKDISNQIRKLMSAAEKCIDSLSGVSDSILGSPGNGRQLNAYEAQMIKTVPEICKLLGLMSRAIDDKVTGNADTNRDYTHLNNFWLDLQRRIEHIDRSYGTDVSKKTTNSTAGRESRSSMRSSVSSNQGSTIEFSFRASRSRSVSAATNRRESGSPELMLSSSSPFDEEPLKSSTTARKLYVNRPTTPTQRKESFLEFEFRSLPRVSQHQLLPTPSTLPTRCNVAEENVHSGTLPKARTPTGGITDSRRRVSAIPQPKFTPMKPTSIPPVPSVPAIPATLNSNPATSLKRPQSSHGMRQNNLVVPKTPTRKQSQAQLRSARRTVEKETPTGTIRSSRKSLVPVPAPNTPHYAAKTISAMVKEQGVIPSSARKTSVTSGDPFGPTSGTKLNHHTSTPNLSVARKQSQSNLSQGTKSPIKTSVVPPVPAIPPQMQQEIEKHGYRIPAGLSPDSQQKYYITYHGDGTAAAGIDHLPAMNPPSVARPKTMARKSMNPIVKEKPRWR
ncbi:hypothetical protein V1512DRAFT_264989 [Lipomyces arxii]|uniref:uncharacterized protein n=1 Tax=Lipomyces arxii TaxID=56418 RepID=UPI0034CEE9E9